MMERKLKLMHHINSSYLASKCHLLSMERSLTNLTHAQNNKIPNALYCHNHSRVCIKYKMSRKLYILNKKKKVFCKYRQTKTIFKIYFSN